MRISGRRTSYPPVAEHRLRSGGSSLTPQVRRTRSQLVLRSSVAEHQARVAARLAQKRFEQEGWGKRILKGIFSPWFFPKFVFTTWALVCLDALLVKTFVGGYARLIVHMGPKLGEKVTVGGVIGALFVFGIPTLLLFRGPLYRRILAPIGDLIVRAWRKLTKAAEKEDPGAYHQLSPHAPMMRLIKTGRVTPDEVHAFIELFGMEELRRYCTDYEMFLILCGEPLPSEMLRKIQAMFGQFIEKIEEEREASKGQGATLAEILAQIRAGVEKGNEWGTVMVQFRKEVAGNLERLAKELQSPLAAIRDELSKMRAEFPAAVQSGQNEILALLREIKARLDGASPPPPPHETTPKEA